MSDPVACKKTPTIQEKQEKIWPEFEKILERNHLLGLVDKWIVRDLLAGNDKNRCYVKHRITADQGSPPDHPDAGPVEFNALEWRVYTESNEYKICADSDIGTGATYLTAYSHSRKCRVGENHHRGNDLPDGAIGESLWSRILLKMLRMELLPLWDHDPKPQNVKLVVDGEDQAPDYDLPTENVTKQQQELIGRRQLF